MKYVFFLLFTAGCFLVPVERVTAQDNKVINDKNAQKREVRGFHGIEISGGIDLYLNQAGEEAVAVSASEAEWRDRIRTEVLDGVLHIYMDTKGFGWGGGGNRHLKAYVACRSIDKLNASGGSDVYIQDALKGERLNLDLAGGSDLSGKLVFGELSVHQSGGSDTHVSGSATRLFIHASGGSDYHGYELVSDNCQVEASGGSDAYLTVNRELVATASGGSDVHYRGSGVVKESHASGSGSITRKD
ncbi:head GIN domain-containing protein [Puia sp. P3]|uniref:head GIN domain-containing protein n=1 Tax=Puia sp. P3 TaxID=3423952 RepID=UPI003D67FFFA